MTATREIHVIQLEPYDDVVSIRDRLNLAEARRVLLVWPHNGSILRRKLDLLLVQRQAIRLGLRLAIVSSDPVVMDHAHELNLSVFPGEVAARKARWKRPHDKVFAAQRDLVAQAELADHIMRMRSGTRSRAGRRWRRALRWVMFLALLLALVCGFFLAAPSATVTITPASRQVYETVMIVADPALADIDIENFRIPATVVTLQATSRVTVRSSGLETAGASLAQGLVTFANTTDQPVLIPLGTVVTTSEQFPVRFETILETTLPAGDEATVQVPIRALEEHAGPAGNVNAGAINRIEGEFPVEISVTNPNPTYGGAIQERATVTAGDHERLIVLGRQQVLQHARDTLLHQLAGDQFLVPGSVVIIEERPEWTLYNAFVGDVAESVSLDLRAEVQAVVVDEELARQVAYAGLAPYIRPGLEIAQDALTITRGDIETIEPNGRVSFVMTVKGNIAVSVDEQAVRDRLRGVSVGEAHRRLERELLLDPDRPPEITTWPGWYNRMPLLPVRINVKVRAP